MRSLVLFAFFALLATVRSAANSYGDEQVTPAPGSAPAQPAPEEAPVESLQETPEGAGSQVSGYDSGVVSESSSYAPAFRNRFRHRMMKHRVLRHRVLRHRVFHRRRFARNAYGDEQVTPGPSHGVAAPAPTEQGPSYQPAPPQAQVHPPVPGCGSAPPPPPPPPPPSSSSSYRRKRVRVARNAYGDEQVTPAPSHGVAAPAPVEQGPSYQPISPPAPPVPDCPSAPVYNSPPAPAPAPHPAPSGYAQAPAVRLFKHRRVARAANSYGDEQVTPAPGAVSSASAPEESPVDAIQETSEGAGSQSSGYDAGVESASYPTSFRNRFRHRFLKHRVLRHRVMKLRRRARAANSYGDEQVTPAPGSAPAQPAPEEAPVESLQTTPEGAGSQVSGYDSGVESGVSSYAPTPSFRNRFRHRVMKHRVLRHRVLRHRVFHRRRFARNAYGDEPVTEAAPAQTAPEVAPVEETPEAAQQIPEGGASVQPSGYRS